MDRRRLLLALLASMVPASRAAARDRPYCIGYLSPGPARPGLDKTLAALGYVEGKNLRYEVRTAPLESPARLAAAARELARADVDVLMAFWSERVEALAAATTTIPIVAGITADPVAQGFATTLAHPTRNVTGLSTGDAEAAPIRLKLFMTLRPALKRIVYMHRTGDPKVWSYPARPLAAVAQAEGISFAMTPVVTLADAEQAFKRLGDPSACFAIQGTQLAVPAADVMSLATKYRIATMGDMDGGALMFYGLEHVDRFARTAAMIDKILRGARPADIPFELPDRTNFILNRRVANAIGVKLGPDVLLRATDLID